MSDWIIQVVVTLGYAGIAALTLLENLFPPIPSELIMPLAGYEASKGLMSLSGAIAAGSIGSTLGACAWYWLGIKVGEQRLRSWIDRRGRWLTLDCHDLDRATQWFGRYGLWAIFFCRLMPGLRTYISLPAGLARMSFMRFLLPTLAGTAIWTAALTYAGTVLGHNYPDIGNWLGIFAWIVLAVVVAGYIWRQLHWGRR